VVEGLSFEDGGTGEKTLLTRVLRGLEFGAGRPGAVDLAAFGISSP